MDLIELARTIQADRNRDVAVETRRRRFMTNLPQTVRSMGDTRPTKATQRPVSTRVTSP